MKNNDPLIDSIRLLPGPLAIFDKSLNILSSSLEWDTTVAKDLEESKKNKSNFSHKFETAIREAFESDYSYFIEDFPIKQIRNKYKFSKFKNDAEELVLAQRIFHTRPEEYRKEELLRQTNTVADIGFWELNLLTGSIIWSEVTRKIHQIPDDFELKLETGINFYKEGADRELISKVINKAIEFGEPWDEDFALVTYLGKDIYVNAKGKAEFENGKCVRLLGTFQDITERVLRNEQLRNSEEQFRLAFENTLIAFLIVDVRDLKILEINNAAEQVFGYNKIEFSQKKITDLYEPEEFQKSYLLIKKLFAQNSQKIETEQYFRNKNGSTIAAKTYFSLNYDSKGKPQKIIAQIQDITELKKKNDEINRFIEVTTNQNTRLINFAHIVSHNLRSHSSNIGMLIDFLKNERDEEEREIQFEMLVQASSMLTETITHLNDVVSVDVNYQEKEELLLYKFIENGVRSVRGLMVEVNFQIVNRVPEDLIVYAVPAYLESIILNLITNSIKYRSPKRKSWLQISAENKKGYTIITASDNGLGINLKRYGDRIFGLYKTFHEHSDARGLGLYMTKSQVEVMGGSIDVQSKVGEGTQFTIKLDEKN